MAHNSTISEKERCRGTAWKGWGSEKRARSANTKYITKITECSSKKKKSFFCLRSLLAELENKWKKYFSHATYTVYHTHQPRVAWVRASSEHTGKNWMGGLRYLRGETQWKIIKNSLALILVYAVVVGAVAGHCVPCICSFPNISLALMPNHLIWARNFVCYNCD